MNYFYLFYCTALATANEFEYELTYFYLFYSTALATANEFEYELTYPDRDSQDNLQNSVALTLVRAQREEISGLVVLVFNLVFAPFKAMR
jgi:hypothetical protein